MKYPWKITALVLILLIPAAIYIFLRTFGHNEFSIPIYNADGEIEPVVIETEHLDGHHVVSYDILLDSSPMAREQFINKIVILSIEVSGGEFTQGTYQTNRIAGKFAVDESVYIIRIMPDDIKEYREDEEYGVDYGNKISNLKIGSEYLEDFCNTQLGLSLEPRGSLSLNRLILLDRKSRIRGYYNPDDFDDVDRLILEVKILLNQTNDI
jgi:protein SCO1/2